MQLEEQGDVRADRARGYNYFGKMSQPSKIVLIFTVSQRITSIRNNESKTMKHIATHMANNANRTKTHMWKTDGGHSWYIGVLHPHTERVGIIPRVIFHCGTEAYIRRLWDKEFRV